MNPTKKTQDALIHLICLALIALLGVTNPVIAKDKAVEKQPIPRVYPYSYPYDEMQCPSGKCDRSNENPGKRKTKKTRAPAHED